MEENVKPIAGMTQSYLNAISCILYFYERHLWNFAAPSVKRTKQITEVQFLLVKIQLLSETKIVALSRDEMGYIETAINLFTSQTTEKIPQTLVRDEVLASCKDLREFLVGILTRQDQYL